eukprot:6211093-Pleurochrysis_carterae.AAC.2
MMPCRKTYSSNSSKTGRCNGEQRKLEIIIEIKSSHCADEFQVCICRRPRQNSTPYSTAPGAVSGIAVSCLSPAGATRHLCCRPAPFAAPLNRSPAPCAVSPLSTRRRVSSLTSHHAAKRTISRRLAPCAVPPLTIQRLALHPSPPGAMRSPPPPGALRGPPRPAGALHCPPPFAAVPSPACRFSPGKINTEYHCGRYSNHANAISVSQQSRRASSALPLLAKHAGINTAARRLSTTGFNTLKKKSPSSPFRSSRHAAATGIPNDRWSRNADGLVAKMDDIHILDVDRDNAWNFYETETL